MAYKIKSRYSNGYRCSCCQSSWESTESADTIEEALGFIPADLEDRKPHDFNGDCEIKEATVIDEETGEEVAWAWASWSYGGRRYSGYKYTRWSGYRPDTGTFEAIYDSGWKKIDRPWDELIAEIQAEQAQKDLEKARADLEKAQKKVAALS